MPKSNVTTVTRKTTRRLVAGKTAAASSSTAAVSISAEDVAKRAYLIYLEEGCPEGRHLEHWTRAEAELRMA